LIGVVRLLIVVVGVGGDLFPIVVPRFVVVVVVVVVTPLPFRCCW